MFLKFSVVNSDMNFIIKNCFIFMCLVNRGRNFDEEKGRRQWNKPDADLEGRRSKCL